MRVQAELDETKIVLHKTIESVLERGEKLDSLVERSDALSAQSKMFYKTAKKQVCAPICVEVTVEFVLCRYVGHRIAWAVISGIVFKSDLSATWFLNN